MTRSFERLVAVCGLALAALTVTPSEGRADSPPAAVTRSVNAEILVLHATQVPGKGAIDERIGNMPQLSKPPFSAYNQYKLLDKKVLPLEKGKPASFGLVNGRNLQLSLSDVKDNRFHVSASISQASGADYLKLLEVAAALNEPFFVAGQTYQQGNLVLVITLRK